MARRTRVARMSHSNTLLHGVPPAGALAAPVFFCSGAQRIADLRGLADAGVPVGVNWSDLSKPALAVLVDYINDGGRAFVDTGAFSAPITDFTALLEGYAGLLERVRSPERCTLVGPDVVGCSKDTHRLIEHHAPTLQTLVARGADLLLPVHATRGGHATAWPYLKCLCPGASPAFPCRKHAVTPESLARFVREARPARLHLLGVGARGHRISMYLAAIASADGTVEVTADGNHLRAMIGPGRSMNRAVIGVGRDGYTAARAADDPVWRDDDETEAWASYMVDGDRDADTDAALAEVLAAYFGSARVAEARAHGTLDDLAAEAPDLVAITACTRARTWIEHERNAGRGARIRREAIRRSFATDHGV